MDRVPEAIRRLSDEVESSLASSLVGTPRVLWDAGHEELLRAWRKESTMNTILQTSSSHHYQWWNSFLTYPTILISAGTSIGMFSTNESVPLRFVLGGLALLGGCLTAWNRQMRAAERSEQYALKAREHAAFVRDVNYVLTLKHDVRPDVKETIGKLRVTFDKMFESQVEPPLSVIRRYEQTHAPVECLYKDNLGGDVNACPPRHMPGPRRDAGVP
jgi:hypothetical protein